LGRRGCAARWCMLSDEKYENAAPHALGRKRVLY